MMAYNNDTIVTVNFQNSFVIVQPHLFIKLQMMKFSKEINKTIYPKLPWFIILLV